MQKRIAREEIKKLAKLKQEHLTWFRALQEKEISNCPWPCAYINNLGVILICNALFADLFNYDKRELLDSNISMLTPAIVRKNHNELVDSFFKNAELDASKHLEVRGISSKGSMMNITISLTLKKQDISGQIQQFVICQVNLESAEVKYKSLYLLQDNSYEYLIWKGALSVVLGIIFIIVPYFSVMFSYNSNIVLYVVRFVMVLDVIINLNTSIVINDEYSTSRTDIFCHYAKNLLIFDVISCFPYTALIDYSRHNHYTSLLNFIILMKIPSIVDTFYKIMDTDKMSRQNRSLFSKYEYYINSYVNLIVVLVTGFLLVNIFTALFVLRMDSYHGQDQWINYVPYLDDVFDQYLKTPSDYANNHYRLIKLVEMYDWNVNLSIWSEIFFQVVHSFSLLKKLNDQNSVERMLELFIKLFGLFFYITLIGVMTNNSLYYQNYMYDYNRKKNVIDKIVSEQNISPELIESVYEDFEKNYLDMRYEDITVLKPDINYASYEQIFLSKHKKILKCELFKPFSFDSITRLSNCTRFSTDFVVWTKKELFDSLYFVETGVLKIQSDSMEVVTEFFDKELVLYEMFIKFIQNYELLSVTSQNNDNQFSRRTSKDTTLISENSQDSQRKSRNKPLTYTDSCYSYNSVYVIIEAYGLYQLMKEDSKVRQILEAYYKKQNSKCDQQSIDYTDGELKVFINKATPALICLSSGEIIHINDVLKSSVGGFVNVGEHINTLLQRVDGESIKYVSNIESGKIIMNVDGVGYNCMVSIEVKSLVVTKSRVRNTNTLEYLGVDDNFILSFKSETNVFKNNRLKVVFGVAQSNFTFFIKEKKLRRRSSIFRSVIMEKDINDTVDIKDDVKEKLKDKFLKEDILEEEKQDDIKDQIRDYIKLNLKEIQQEETHEFNDKSNKSLGDKGHKKKKSLKIDNSKQKQLRNIDANKTNTNSNNLADKQKNSKDILNLDKPKKPIRISKKNTKGKRNKSVDFKGHRILNAQIEDDKIENELNSFDVDENSEIL